jgi:hypothetical protein
MKNTSLRSASALLAAILAGLAFANASADSSDTDNSSQSNAPGNIEAANGPIPGDVTLYQSELECQNGIDTPGYMSFLNGAEIADGQRSGLFPCATFTGSHDGANAVYAFRSLDDYPGISYINNGDPGVIYIVGGEYPVPSDPNMAGPFIAKANATTGKEIWRTYLDNLNVSGHFIGNANLNILANGNIAFAWSRFVALIDADTGLILKTNTLPSGAAEPEDVNFKHLTVAPDGTLILKDQTRPKGCTIQGTLGIITCARQGMPMQNSVLVAVDPDTLEILDQLELPEPAASPHIVDIYNGRIAIYVGLNSSLRRYYWDPESKKLSVDEDWVVKPLAPGQTALTAPSVIGNWISVQLNGLFTNKAASSVVVVNMDDASNVHTIYPFGDTLAEGEISFAPPKGTADPATSMIYSADMGMKKVAGIYLDQETGELETKFVLDDITSTFQPMIGPADSRVLMLTNIKLSSDDQTILNAFETSKYTEQLTWRDALTGDLLAESDYFEPLTINSLTTPGYGGRVYFPTAMGNGFYVLQPMPVPGTSGN